MKTIALLILALLFTTALCAAEGTRNEVVWWEEDFESAGHGWTHYAEYSSMWHSVYVPNNVYPGPYSYWEMGPGYMGHQYFMLDTPQSTLTDSTATLTFQYRINIQYTDGASPPYNGYDAFNVRLSTDGGSSWIPISGTPAYNVTSSYAFGEDFEEGPGIPGWAGELGTGLGNTASFDLRAYVGQAVKIRFAFASSGVVAPESYYLRLDDIAFGDYINHGENDGQLISTSLVSPPIQLPDTGTIRVDFMLRGQHYEYFLWEVCGEDGVWESMAYDTYFGTSPHQYDNPPAEWSSLVDYYHNGHTDFNRLELSGTWHPYSGQTVRFRWTFVSNYNTPVGSGLWLDDVKIYHTLNLAAPENLQANSTVLT